MFSKNYTKYNENKPQNLNSKILIINKKRIKPKTNIFYLTLNLKQ